MAVKMKLVTVFIGMLYDSVWQKPGTVLSMDAARADVLAAKSPPVVKIGEHVVDVDDEGHVIEPGEVADGPTFTPADFPAAEELAAAGIMNPDQLGELMKRKGDAWFTEVKGIGKKSAAVIADALAKLNAAL
jgi:hypothetical protein